MKDLRSFGLYISIILTMFSCSKEDDSIHVKTTENQISEDNQNNTDENQENKVFVFDTSLNTNLPPRKGHEMISFQGKYWFMGGEEPKTSSPRDGNEKYNDIWNSSDGITWNKVKENAEWSKRSYFNLFEFDNKLWIIAGESPVFQDWLNDVWNSSDGITWEQVTESGPWQERLSPTVKIHDNKMYLIGGHSTTNWHLYQDIWESENGIQWNKVGEISDDLLGNTNSRQGIYRHDILEFNNAYYLISGNVASSFISLTRVLKSSNLIDWEVITEDVPWKDNIQSIFANNRSFVYDNKICTVIYNENEDGKKVQNVYTSIDGVNWEDTLSLPIIGDATTNPTSFMDKPRSLKVSDKIYLFGSFNASVLYPTLDTKMHLVQIYMD
ncbi:Kelch repeat-containing protein [Aureivirga marina]|uniref:hypothetical protein n=1 Tax=Aureivirga marina TaxID=1182451 RepID=UPI0018C9E8CB|nr:hypothetical protein [Aureivirga marina]